MVVCYFAFLWHWEESRWGPQNDISYSLPRYICGTNAANGTRPECQLGTDNVGQRICICAVQLYKYSAGQAISVGSETEFTLGVEEPSQNWKGDKGGLLNCREGMKSEVFDRVNLG